MFRQDRRTHKPAFDGKKARQKRTQHVAETQQRKREKHQDQARHQVPNIPDVTDWPRMIERCAQRDMNAIKYVRNLLSSETQPAPIQSVVDHGLVPLATAFLQPREDPEFQFEGVWILTNIASGTHEHVAAIIQAGAVPLMVQLLHSPVEKVREQSLWALCNIAGDGDLPRATVLSHGIVPSLLTLVRPGTSVDMMKNMAWILSNLVQELPDAIFESICPLIPVMVQLLHAPREEVLLDILNAFSHLSRDFSPDNSRIQAIVDAGACERLVFLTGHPHPMVRNSAVQTLGNLVTGQDAQTQVVLDAGFLKALEHLFDIPPMLKAVCWVLSNIAAGNPTQVEQVIPFVPRLIAVASSPSVPTPTAKEAIITLCHLFLDGTDEQVQRLAQPHVVGAMRAFREFPDPEVQQLWQRASKRVSQ